MIQLANPRIGESEINAVTQALEEGNLSTGSPVAEFEDAFAEYVGRHAGAAVCSGSEALEMVIKASPLEPGDGVILSAYNCGAVLYAVLRSGLIPIFANIRTDSYNINPASVEPAIDTGQPNVRGMVITHLYGYPCDMGPLLDIADEHDLTIIDDFAQAPGATYRGTKVGTYGLAGVCSFGATKNLTTAEGGMVVSDDEELIDQIKSRRTNTGSSADKSRRSVRMNDIEALIGLAQLRRYSAFLKAKRQLALLYREQLPGDVILPPESDKREHAYHGFPIRTSDQLELQDYLRTKSIEAAAVYDTPLYDYGCVDEKNLDRYPEVDQVCSEVLLLPIHSNLSDDDVLDVTQAVREFFIGNR